MKKKTLSIILAAITLTSCCFMTGCGELVDVAPKSYAEWDNNYIYRGNLRTKTTGEDEEVLIQTLTKNDVEYTVTNAHYYEYKADEIYMCLDLETSTQNVGEKKETTCFAVYDVKEKTSHAIYWAEVDAYISYIYELQEDYAILVTYDRYGNSEEGQYIRVDYEGNVLSDNDNWMMTMNRAGDYFVSQKNGQFFYCTLDDNNQIPMFTLTGAFRYYEVEYIEKGAHKGFLIQIENEEYDYCGMYFYDIVQKKTSELVPFGTDWRYEEPFATGNEELRYFVAGEYTEIEYTSSFWMFAPIFYPLPLFLPKTYENDYTYSGLKNCKLLELNWDSEEVTANLVYDFGTEYGAKDFSWFYILENGNLYFEAEELVLVEGTGCMGGSGTQSSYYLLDNKDGKLITTKYQSSYSSITEEEIWQNKRDAGVECGQYKYFFDEEFYGWSSCAYTLYRYDTETKTDVVMQFWAPDEGYEEGARTVATSDGNVDLRYSVEMWRDSDDTYSWNYDNDFLVRNY